MKTILTRMLLLIMLFTSIICLSTTPSFANSSKSTVTLYSVSWCPYCTATKRFLEKNKISFTECDIEKSKQCHHEYLKQDGQGVPLLVVGKEHITGYEPYEFERALQKAGLLKH